MPSRGPRATAGHRELSSGLWYPAFLLLLDGQVGVPHAFAGYLLPALVGNIIGGTALFSLLAYAQVREEID